MSHALLGDLVLLDGWGRHDPEDGWMEGINKFGGFWMHA